MPARGYLILNAWGPAPRTTYGKHNLGPAAALVAGFSETEGPSPYCLCNFGVCVPQGLHMYSWASVRGLYLRLDCAHFGHSWPCWGPGRGDVPAQQGGEEGRRDIPVHQGDEGPLVGQISPRGMENGKTHSRRREAKPWKARGGIHCRAL